MTDCELYWAAGFLEGEGCFHCSGGYMRITAGQKQREPLERLIDTFGGRIYDQANRDLFLWSLAAKADVDAALALLYPLMSTRRREQIDAALAKRMARGKPGERNRRKTHCPNGHPYDRFEVDATRTRRRCSICLRAQRKASRA